MAVDETMVVFEDRLYNTIKIKNKPIAEGFKIWCIASEGYIYSFRFHSRLYRSEDMKKSRKILQAKGSVELAPTFLSSNRPRYRFTVKTPR